MSHDKFDKVGKFIEEHRDICRAFKGVRPGVLESCYRKSNRRPYILLMQSHLDHPSKCDTVFFLTMIHVLKSVGEVAIHHALAEGQSLYQIFSHKVSNRKHEMPIGSRSNETVSLGDSI